MPASTVSAPSALAADAGARIAEMGGNAVDAAIAATVVGMISDPGIIGPGAGCFLTVWPPDGDAMVIDGYVALPGLAGPLPPDGVFGSRMHMDYGGGMETAIGPGSVAVPGAWAALGVAAETLGNLAWGELLSPAIELAATGFPLSEVAARYLRYSFEPILSRAPVFGRALRGPGGALVPPGSLVHPDGLSDALETIATEGPGSWYSGTIARLLVEAMADTGGWITATDLASYRAISRSPTVVRLGEWEVATNSPSAIGGAVVGALLLLLDAAGSGDSEVMIDTQRAVLAFREREFDSKSDLAAAHRLLDIARFGDRRRLLEAPSTIHVSCVDDTGLACAVTTSAGYGSGVEIPGTGLALNNCLGELELHPRGLAHLEPGARLASNMAPTVARHQDGTVLAVGSPGAARITTAVASVLAGVCLEGRDLFSAVAAPRLHVETFDGVLTVAFEESLQPEVPGDMVARPLPDHSMYFGGVAAAVRLADGRLEAVADPRRSGATATGGTT